jgi:hypothetical protein
MSTQEVRKVGHSGLLGESARFLTRQATSNVSPPGRFRRIPFGNGSETNAPDYSATKLCSRAASSRTRTRSPATFSLLGAAQINRLCVWRPLVILSGCALEYTPWQSYCNLIEGKGVILADLVVKSRSRSSAEDRVSFAWGFEFYGGLEPVGGVP